MKLNFYNQTIAWLFLLKFLLFMGNSLAGYSMHEVKLAVPKSNQILNMWEKQRPKSQDYRHSSNAVGLEEICPGQALVFEVKAGTVVLMGSERLEGLKPCYVDDFTDGQQQFDLCIDKLDGNGKPTIYRTPLRYTVAQAQNNPEELYRDENLFVSVLYPNPVGAMAFISYKVEQPGLQVAIVLKNVLGSEVGIFPLDVMGRMLKISTEDLRPGMYFYTLTIDGEAKVTKKFLVKR